MQIWSPLMMYEPNGHLFTPVDTEAPRRVVRLRELGLGDRPEPEFDDFARMLATSTNSPLAMVNFVSEDRQYFAGLHAPALVQGGPSGGGGRRPGAGHDQAAGLVPARGG